MLLDSVRFILIVYQVRVRILYTCGWVWSSLNFWEICIKKDGKSVWVSEKY